LIDARELSAWAEEEWRCEGVARVEAEERVADFDRRLREAEARCAAAENADTAGVQQEGGEWERQCGGAGEGGGDARDPFTLWQPGAPIYSSMRTHVS
jgi:hypothetical protein